MKNSHWKTMLGAVSALALLGACGGGDPSGSSTQTEQSATQAPVKLETPPAGQLPEGVTPTAYELSLFLDPAKDDFDGSVDISLELDAPHSRIWLHALGPQITRAEAFLPDKTTVQGTFTGDQAEGGVSRIDFERPIPAGTATLSLSYTAPYNRSLAGLYRADQGGREYLASQMEPIDARRLLPSFDEPRFKTPFTVEITAPNDVTVITNGALKQQLPQVDDVTLHRFETTRPLPTYLLGFIVGPYDEVVGDDIPANSVRSEPVPFRGFAPDGKGENLKEAMDSTFKMLEFQETYFGVPYPYGKLDIAAVPEFAFGAMENAGIIIYRESALLIDDRTSLGRKRSIFSIHAHELAHQWFGNLVTPKWWDDIWLNESFATWFAYKTMHDFDPDGGFDRVGTRRALSAMGSDSLKSARQIRNPITRNGDIMDAFDGITYSKGGGVLGMFESYLGEDAFREGVRTHMKRFPDGVADVNDFMSSLADGSGDPAVVEAFSSFIFQPGIPYLNVQPACDTPEGISLKVQQSRYAPLGSEIDKSQTWTVPLAISWGSSDGSRGSSTYILDEADDAISLEQGPCPDWVMPNTDGKGYWRFTTTPENWKALTENFTRLSPGEQLVFADSLTAAFNAGDISAVTMLEGLKATVDGEWDAVQQGMNEIKSYLSLLDETDRPKLRKFIGELYAPAWEFYGDRTAAQLSQGERLLQEALYDAMVYQANEPEMVADLKARARAYVGADGGDPDRDAVPSSELYAAISLAAADGNVDFFKGALSTAYTTDNQSERSTIFAALARSLPAEDVAILLKEANGDGFTGREMYATFMNSLSNENAREQNWTLFKQSWMNLVARTPSFRKANLASAVGAFCDVEKSAEAAEFFRENAGDIPGYERSLAQALESSALCAGLKKEKAAELAAALE